MLVSKFTGRLAVPGGDTKDYQLLLCHVLALRGGVQHGHPDGLFRAILTVWSPARFHTGESRASAKGRWALGNGRHRVERMWDGLYDDEIDPVLDPVVFSVQSEHSN